LSVPLWLCLSTLGTRFFGELIDHGYALAERFARHLAAAADFELCVPPDTNIVCFRHVPEGVADLDAHQRTLRARIRRDGEFFIVQTVLGGKVWLRTSLMNPLTTEADLVALMDAIREAAM
jgi:L-2,4-diaminobutyrate decarboxylase